MIDYINIGSTPPDEECAQVGSDDYRKASKLEARAYINQLKRHCGEPPEGCRLSSRAFDHEYGIYHEVVCYFKTDDEEAYNYALKCESDGPSEWDDQARKELNDADYFGLTLRRLRAGND